MAEVSSRSDRLPLPPGPGPTLERPVGAESPPPQAKKRSRRLTDVTTFTVFVTMAAASQVASPPLPRGLRGGFYKFVRLWQHRSGIVGLMSKTPNCSHCVHYHVTWDNRFPRGCRYFGFKTRNQPSLDVLVTTGQNCVFFEPTQKHRATYQALPVLPPNSSFTIQG